MSKETFRQREVTFDVETDDMIKVTAKGYNKQLVRVSGAGANSQNYTMDTTAIPILTCDKKSLGGGGITISVSTYDVLSIKKTLFGIKVAVISSV
ncbi:MAG: hypothetical protein FWD23_06025 [Oscillospiraceae bacterium]|nr:hypothetical protein [Oscillospiraceae bacterium]